MQIMMGLYTHFFNTTFVASMRTIDPPICASEYAQPPTQTPLNELLLPPGMGEALTMDTCLQLSGRMASVWRFIYLLWLHTLGGQKHYMCVCVCAWTRKLCILWPYYSFWKHYRLRFENVYIGHFDRKE